MWMCICSESSRSLVSAFCFIGVLFLSAAPVAAQEPNIVTRLESKRIYAGESVRYDVAFQNIDGATKPDLSALEQDFAIDFLGHSPSQSQSIVIINGRQRQSLERQDLYSFTLTPRSSGTFRIPGPTFDSDGQSLTGRDQTLVVVAPDEQDLVRLEMQVEPQSVYPLQEFTATLLVRIKGVPAPFDDTDPVMFRVDRTLSVPWLSTEELPSGLIPQRELSEVVSPWVASRGAGFEMNGLASQSGFFSTRRLTFHPDPRKITLPDADGKESTYWEYRFSRRFTADKPGMINLGPVNCKGQFVAGLKDEQPTAQSVYAIAAPATIVVKDVPTEGRPASYIGAFGKFEFESDLTPLKSRVGDPMTLTLTLRGSGSLESAVPPALENIPVIADNFKTYDATQNTSANQRQFVYSIRPTSTKLTEFPPIEIAYFDVEQEQYVIKSSAEIPIAISPAEALSGDDIVASPSAAKPAEGSAAIEMNENGLFGNYSNPAELRNESVDAQLWVLSWVGIIAIWAVAYAGIRTLLSRRGDIVGQRRRSAASRARAAIQSLDGADASAVIDGVRSAIAGFVADVAQCNESGLTSREVAEQLTKLQLSSDVVSQVTEFFEQCEASRYGGTSAAPELKTAGQSVLDTLISECRVKKLLR